MSIARISPSVIEGTLTPPPSKSAAHRTLICAALAGGGTVAGYQPSADMRATVSALSALGLSASREELRLTLSKTAEPLTAPTVDCIESGSTLRFLIPVFAALGIPATFIGQGRLPQRPIGVYTDLLPDHGVTCETSGGLPLRISGKLRPGTFSLPGDVSSQFISGLLFALPLCEEDSDIHLTSPLESAGYVEMTLRCLKDAGIQIVPFENGWHVPGHQMYARTSFQVESDWSQAAFLLAAGALGGHVALTGLDTRSSQGDREALALFRRFGADIREENGTIHCRKAPLHGIDIDARQIPDLVPILAVTAAGAQGLTRITGAARLRLKESDRLAAVCRCLQLLGGDVEEQPDGLLIRGGKPLHGNRVPGCNDHRMVMSMSVAALLCDTPLEVDDAQSVEKSWPAFFKDYQRIGGNVHVVNHW